MSHQPLRLGSHRALLAISIAVPVVEGAILQGIGPRTSLPLAPQVTAIAPYGTFHDLRWLFVYHRSWLEFALEAVAFVAFRTALNTALVLTAWPTGEPRPAPAAMARRVAIFTVTTAVVLSPFVVLLVGMSVVSISWLFFVSVPAMLIVALLVHHGAVVGTWWRERPPLRTVGWIAFTFVVLTLTSATVTLVPAALRLPAIALGGLFNAWAWFGIVHALTLRRRSTRFVPIAPIGVVSLMAVIALGVTLGFAVVTRPGDLKRAQGTGVTHAGRPVLVVSGFGSHWDGGDTGVAFRGDFDERRFSYRGAAADPDGTPLPYTKDDTYRAIPDLLASMADQVETFHRITGQPITIVAESEGALVAKAYVLAFPDAPVRQLIMLSPLVAPGRVYYPPSHADGWGKAAGWELRILTSLLRHLSPLTISTDTPLLRSIVDNAPALRDALRCPAGEVNQVVFFPLADAVVAPQPRTGLLRTKTVPAFHGGLLTNRSVQRTISVVLNDGNLPRFEFWAAGSRLIRAAAIAWQVPDLPLTLNREWQPIGLSPPTCASIGHVLRSWVE